MALAFLPDKPQYLVAGFLNYVESRNLLAGSQQWTENVLAPQK